MKPLHQIVLFLISQCEAYEVQIVTQDKEIKVLREKLKALNTSLALMKKEELQNAI